MDEIASIYGMVQGPDGGIGEILITLIGAGGVLTRVVDYFKKDKCFKIKISTDQESAGKTVEIEGTNMDEEELLKSCENERLYVYGKIAEIYV